MFWALLVLTLAVLLVVLPVYRFLRRPWRKPPPSQRKVCVVLGSGGHTTEVLRLVSVFSSRFSKRVYILADSDKISQDKVLTVEKESFTGGDFELVRIPRSREVRQSFLTSFFTTLKSLLVSVPLVWRADFQFLVCNGPGTCIPICLVAFALDLFLGRRCVILFVESLCRAETLSLSGTILYHLRIADAFFVQWPRLQPKFPRSKYIGRLC